VFCGFRLVFGYEQLKKTVVSQTSGIVIAPVPQGRYLRSSSTSKPFSSSARLAALSLQRRTEDDAAPDGLATDGGGVVSTKISTPDGAGGLLNPRQQVR
jgi:hypothetical protein